MHYDELKILIEVLEPIAERGGLPQNFMRNLRIRYDYVRLRKEGLKGREAKLHLSRVYCTGIKNIETILYSKREEGENHATDRR